MDAIDWTDFPFALPDILESMQVHQLVQFGQDFLAFISKAYGLVGDLPPVLMRNDPSFNAEVAFETIILNKGIVLHAIRSDEYYSSFEGLEI